MKEYCGSNRCWLVKISAVLLLLTVVACSSTQGPVIIRESSIPASTAPKEGAGVERGGSDVQPVSPDQQHTVIPLVEKLVTQSNIEISNKNYEKAISLAERGLRINRKDPRLYLVLSKAYRGGSNYKQSVYFAKQGLRYIEKSGEVYQALLSLSK